MIVPETSKNPGRARSPVTGFHGQITTIPKVLAKRSIMLWIRLATGFLFSTMLLAQELPAGTAIPIKLSTGLNAKHDEAGKKIEGVVMQDVLLPANTKIREKARVTGHLVSVTRPSRSGSGMVVRFDTIEDQAHTIPLKAAVLALASVDNVSQARTPINSSSDLDPVSQWVTRQVGGDVVNRGRGKVGSGEGMIGTWVEGSSVRMKLTPNPQAGCPDGPGYDEEQAVWVFSSAACGTYGLGGLKIVSSGATPPIGDIVLKSTGNVALRGGSGWLLIVVADQ